jgi:hypothetical protein
MFPVPGSGIVKRRKTSGPVAKANAARRHATDTDMSEAFRRARSSIGQITTDLNELRRRTTLAVKSPRRPAKSK